MQPVVSVVIPCKNDGAYIEEAIISVRKQTFKSIEIIIVNDRSDDAVTLAVLQKIEKNGIIVCQGLGLGPAAARNMAIAKACGKYILPLDADDMIAATYIQKAVDVMEKKPNVGIVYCEANKFGLETGKWDLPSYSLENILFDNIIFVTALFRRRDWEACGGFNENLIYGMEDYDFWLSILELGREVIQIPEVLFYYRIKQKSRTTRFSSDTEKMLETYITIYQRHQQLYLNNLELFYYVSKKRIIEMSASISNIRRAYLKLSRIPGISLVKKTVKRFLQNRD